ncbi:MAG: hypothetical protein NUW37_16875 [Planctomycetes bacterium]|nr:hypothetical protein [Planctomycetota bacterium]
MIKNGIFSVALTGALIAIASTCYAEEYAPTTTPIADGVEFSTEITHEYFPLSKIGYAEFRGGGDHVIRRVLGETRKAKDIDCLILMEEEYSDDELAEISYNYFGQTPDGTVYYFGEEVDMYTNGRVTSHGGAWLVGDTTDEPCIFMPGELHVGFKFKRENSPPAAEEFDLIEKLDGSLRLRSGNFTDVLVVAEGDEDDNWKEHKYYAKGIGLISENRVLNLVEYREREVEERPAEDF